MMTAHLNSSFEYDLLVIGGGSGGVAAAQQAAQYGARVALVERDALGGTCVNRGCVPKKLMLYASDFARQFKAAQGYGWEVPQPKLHWSRFCDRLHQHVAHLQQVYRQKLQDSGVEILQGQARFIDEHKVEIEGDRPVTAATLLLAVGGHPVRPDIPGIEQAITSREMFHLPEVPRRLGVLGGGYIGVEFGCMMEALGAEVTIIDSEALILSRFDREVRQTLQTAMTQRGITILGQTTLEAIHSQENGLKLSLSNGKTCEVDTLLCAVGRKPTLQGLNLEDAGVEVKNGAIAVDDDSRTSQPHLFAIGDCTDRMPLTPVAIAEGRAFADTVFGQQPRTVDYQWVPSAVFCRPEAAMVGLTEEQAQAQGSIRCYCSQFTPLFEHLAESDESALIKLVVDTQRDRILGAHMVGQHAADIIQSLAVAIKQGIPAAEFHRTLGIHPTLGEEFFALG